MGTLTDRAERAVLGAMLADPAACRTLRRVLQPGDFQDPWYQRIYQVITSVSKDGQRDAARLRAAVCQADPSLTRYDLDQLADGCPNPQHGTAYGSMLVFGYSQRYLAERGQELNARAGQLRRHAGIISRADAGAGDAIASAATHLSRLGNALRAHAATGVPAETGTAIPVLRYPATEQARREELVLAAFVHMKPADVKDILWVVGPQDIKDPYRRAVLEVIDAMVWDGRPIDELTLDWAIAERGLPLQPKGGGATFGERLARLPVNHQEALTAARALQGQQASTKLGATPQQQGVAGTPRVTGNRSPRHPAGSQLPPILKLHRGGLPPDSPDPGPRPR